jgi:hypothetical protein
LELEITADLVNQAKYDEALDSYGNLLDKRPGNTTVLLIKVLYFHY